MSSEAGAREQVGQVRRQIHAWPVHIPLVLALVGGWLLGPASGTPAAADAIRVQAVPGLVYQVAAGDHFAAWGLVVNRPGPPPPPGPGPVRPPPPLTTSVLWAADLSVTPPRVFTVAEALAVQGPFSLSGTRLAWAAPAPAGGRYDLHLYDLVAGQPLPVPADATGPGAPVLSGDWLVWGGPQTGSAPAIKAARLGSTERRTIARYADAAGGLAAPLPLAADATRVAYVAAPATGGAAALHLYTFANDNNLLVHTFGGDDPPPTRLTLSGADVFYEQAVSGAPGTVSVVRWNLGQGQQVLGTAQAGSLAVGGGIVAWLGSAAPHTLQTYDLGVGGPLTGTLLPGSAVPAGPLGLSASWLAWADRRDPSAPAIYAVRLADQGVPDATFTALWQQADGPVAAGQVARTWLWGPAPQGFAERVEPFTGRVRYYDKARMEVHDPTADPHSPWYVTNGLLVAELVLGCVHISATDCAPRATAAALVAGDADSPDAPSYAALAGVTSLGGVGRAPDRRGALITASLDRAGRVGTDAPPGNAQRISTYEPATGHNVAAVFADYLQAAAGGAGQPAQFAPLQVVGYPIAEPYWIRIRAAGQPRQVLMQAFERRVLTYSPDNPPGWQVEMGNVGRAYYAWRGTAGLLAAPFLH